MIAESEKFICFVRNYLQQIIMANPEKAGTPLKNGEQCEDRGQREQQDRN